ncbi:hypothetical protein DXG01_016851 [Tephrocybe rancida]|nr:hypothetical protein DXG01_016851 [Tephrocybe rancida]
MFTHVMLAIQQVLEAIAEYMYQPSWNRFRLDPGYKFLRALDWNAHKRDISLTLAAMQHHAKMVGAHIKDFLKALNRFYLSPDDLESVSSRDSMVTSVQENFAQGSSREELKKLLAQPGYRLPDNHVLATAQHELVGGSIQFDQGVYYQHRPRFTHGQQAMDMGYGLSLPVVNPINTPYQSISTVQGVRNLRFKLPPSTSNLGGDGGTPNNGDGYQPHCTRGSGDGPPDDDLGFGGGGGGHPGCPGGGPPGQRGGPPGGGPSSGRPPGGGAPGGDGFPGGGPNNQFDNNAARFCVDDHWQLNPKLNFSIMPSWNRLGETALDYISDMSKLAALSNHMSAGLAQMAPQKWTSPADRCAFSEDWSVLLLAIHEQFLDDNWLQERVHEFEEMRFHQQNHKEEMPIDFIQRCLQYNNFLYPEEDDGARVVTRVLRTKPMSWGHILNEQACPSVFALQSTASQMGAILVGTWQMAEAANKQAAPSPVNNSTSQGNRTFRRRQNANAVLVETGDESALDSKSDQGEEPPKEVNFVCNSNKTAEKNSSHPPWPGGKVLNGYSFTRDDSVKND